MAVNARTEKFQHIEVFDKPALFTNGRIARDTVPKGWYCYDIRGSDDDPGELCYIHKVPGLNDESNEYFYQFNERTGACEGKITGLIEFDGARYYAINGVAKSGWWNLTDADGENSYYYFDPETFQGLNGENSSFFPNVTYQFENGKLVKGAWLATDHGKRYYYGPGFVQGKWYTIDGNLYFFNQDGYRYEGLRYVKLRDNHDDPIYWDDFGEDDVCHGVYQHTGLFYLNGNTYYTINGMVCNGLYLAEDGYYYYFGSVDYTAVKNTRHWVSYPNDTGFAPAFYSFDEDGRMIIDTPDPSKDGIVNEDGELYYYVNGVRFYAGLIQIGGDYYYVNSSCKVVTNQRYWISKTNDLLPATFYNFDADGKMTDAPIPTPEPDPELKNGIINEDGELYYYVDGVKTYAGLIQIDGDYYYVSACIGNDLPCRKAIYSDPLWRNLSAGGRASAHRGLVHGVFLPWRRQKSIPILEQMLTCTSLKITMRALSAVKSMMPYRQRWHGGMQQRAPPRTQSRGCPPTPASMRSRNVWSAVSAGPCIAAAHGHETGKNESYGAV